MTVRTPSPIPDDEDEGFECEDCGDAFYKQELMRWLVVDGEERQLCVACASHYDNEQDGDE